MFMSFRKLIYPIKKNILITNRFYNFKRIIMYFIKNKKIKCFYLFFPEDKKNFKDHILSFLGIQSIEFKKKLYKVISIYPALHSEKFNLSINL